MPPSEPSHDSEEDEFDMDDANSEHGDSDRDHGNGGAQDDGTEEADDDSNTDDSDDDDEDEDGEGEEVEEADQDNEDDEDEERLQQELQESLAMDIDAELRELEASAAELPSLAVRDGDGDAAMADDDDLFGDDLGQDEAPMGEPRGISPAMRHRSLAPLDIPPLSPHEERSTIIQDEPSTPLERESRTSPISVKMASPARQPSSPTPAARRHQHFLAPIGNKPSKSSLALNGTAPPPAEGTPSRFPRSYNVEAICALPHPVPTHALASSYCMTHFLTGSDDGYIRNYDIFSAVNSKNFLTQPQRQHAGVVEGLFKSGQVRCWWENPVLSESQKRIGLLSNNALPSAGAAFSFAPQLLDEDHLAPVYSLIMHSDALWALAGSDTGHVNLFTVRHEPGKLIHTMDKHRGPVSAMAMDYDEKGFFSAGWDGEVVQWDLNTGKNVRNFTAHGAQLAAVALRPAYSGTYIDPAPQGGVVWKRKNRDKAKGVKQEEKITEFASEGVAGEHDPFHNRHDFAATPGRLSVDSPDVHMKSESMSGQHIFHPDQPNPTTTEAGGDDDSKSDASFDPLFDEEGDDGDNASSDGPPPQPPQQVYPSPTVQPAPHQPIPQQQYPTTYASSTRPGIPGVPQSHLVTFSTNIPPQAPQPPPIPVLHPQPPPPPGGVESYFQSAASGAQPIQEGQQFQFQLAKPGGKMTKKAKAAAAAAQAQQSTPAPVNPQSTMHHLATPTPAAHPQPSLAIPTSTHQPAGIAPPKNAPPLLGYNEYQNYSSNLLMTAFIDGQVVLWDRRVSTPGRGVGRLWMSEKTPPWCLSACWSPDGGQIYAGRRNGTVDVWDVRSMGTSGPNNIPRLLKTIRNPPSSGVVSCVVPFPDCRHIATASVDNIRLWNVAEAGGEDSSMSRSSVTRGNFLFKIIPGHHGGYISQMLIDPGARFMITSSSNRGWHGDSTKTVFVHDIKQVF